MFETDLISHEIVRIQVPSIPMEVLIPLTQWSDDQPSEYEIIDLPDGDQFELKIDVDNKISPRIMYCSVFTDGSVVTTCGYSGLDINFTRESIGQVNICITEPPNV